jgi:predicted dehydrogenase
MNASKDGFRNTAAISRRRFLNKTTGALGTVCLVPAHVLANKGGASPNEKLNLAAVGLGYRGYRNLRKCAEENIVALCDVDWKLAAPVAEQFPEATRHTDYRHMFDRHPELDAVLIATPDHTHAVITAEAMRRGCHVYTEMPLTHCVWEARRLSRLSRETGVVTQMGNESHSEPVAREICEWVESGRLGPIREVECWTNRPQWPQGMTERPRPCGAPKSLHWDLWIGPAEMTPYSPAYHPCDWKGWRNFGTGALGAMGCYLLDPIFWSLRLGEAPNYIVEADSTGASTFAYPRSSTVRYHFPARGEMPPVTVTWRDGGRKPPLPKGWPANRKTPGSNGIFLIGDQHTLTTDQATGTYTTRLVPESLMTKIDMPNQRLPRLERGPRFDPTRHQHEWLRACKKGEQPGSNFIDSGPLTEMVLLGNIAVLSGKRIQWDPEKMMITNEPEANRFLRREYRQGWKL